MTSFTPPAGASFKRNPYYWMETPPLGEIDFVWNYVGSTKPRSGYYDVDIYDVAMIAGAYRSTATRKPSPKYIAGADVAPIGGAINIYDIVTVTRFYGQQWGSYP